MLSRQLNGPHLDGFISEAALLLGLEVDHPPRARGGGGGRARAIESRPGGEAVGLGGGHVGGGQSMSDEVLQDVEEELRYRLEESPEFVLLQGEEGAQQGEHTGRVHVS